MHGQQNIKISDISNTNLVLARHLEVEETVMTLAYVSLYIRSDLLQFLYFCCSTHKIPIHCKITIWWISEIYAKYLVTLATRVSKIAKATISFVMSARLSVHMQ